MMLGLTDLSDSSEDDETNCLQQPTSPSISKKTLPQPSNRSFSLKSGSFRTSTRIKRYKTIPIREPSSSDSFSHSSDDNEQTSKVFDEANKQNTYLKCKIRGCSVKKPSEQDLFEHVRIDHPDRKHRCNICPVAFKLKGDLTGHSRTHREDNPFECDECGKKFNRKTTLRNHKVIHNEQQMIACRLGKCGLRMTRENLEEHIKASHPEYEHKCSICPMSFKWNSSLIVHQQAHTGDKPYKCKECGKKFSRMANYERHQRVHTGERPFKCEVCGKKFTQLGTLKAHMRTHTGEKPFSCTFCGEKFAQSISQRLHEVSCSMKL
eukprot:sb/3466852/